MAPFAPRRARLWPSLTGDRYAYLYDLNRAIGQLDLEPPVELLPKRGDILLSALMGSWSAVQYATAAAPYLRPLCDCAECNGRWYKRDGWSFWQP